MGEHIELRLQPLVTCDDVIEELGRGKVLVGKSTADLTNSFECKIGRHASLEKVLD
jgi:hypothetical protein